MSDWEYEYQDVLPARVRGPSSGGQVALRLCPGIDEWRGPRAWDVAAELVPPDCCDPGADLLIVCEDGKVAWIMRLPRYELTVHLPGPFTQADYPPLIDRVVPVISAAMKRHELGPQVETWDGGPGSHESDWECQVQVNDLRRAVTVLREALAGLGVQANARIDVSPGVPPAEDIRSYPLVPQGDDVDWSDLPMV